MVVSCQPYAPAAFTPRSIPEDRKHTWYSFLLEAESTPGPWVKSVDTSVTQNDRIPTHSIDVSVWGPSIRISRIPGNIPGVWKYVTPSFSSSFPKSLSETWELVDAEVFHIRTAALIFVCNFRWKSAVHFNEGNNSLRVAVI